MCGTSNWSRWCPKMLSFCHWLNRRYWNDDVNTKDVLCSLFWPAVEQLTCCIFVQAVASSKADRWMMIIDDVLACQKDKIWMVFLDLPHGVTRSKFYSCNMSFLGETKWKQLQDSILPLYDDQWRVRKFSFPLGTTSEVLCMLKFDSV